MQLKTHTVAATTSCAATTASCPRVRFVRDVWPRKRFRARTLSYAQRPLCAAPPASCPRVRVVRDVWPDIGSSAKMLPS
eukprot:6855955-Prymnesium_polylepis.1